MTHSPSPDSLRRLYREWVEEQIEEYKDAVPRSELLRIADEVVAGLETNRNGQYQLTELLLLEEVDRTILRRLRLPGFRTWSAAYLEYLARDPATPPDEEPEPVDPREASAASI